LKHEAIRSYVRANTSRILFDYADILCYNDDGTTATQTWNGHTYPGITAQNLGDESIGHIGSAGAIRLAKAQWWLLARLAGWDGGTTAVNELEADDQTLIQIEKEGDEISVTIPSQLNAARVCLYDITGSILKVWDHVSEPLKFNTLSMRHGLYLIVVTLSNTRYVRKLLI